MDFFLSGDDAMKNMTLLLWCLGPGECLHLLLLLWQYTPGYHDSTPRIMTVQPGLLWQYTPVWMSEYNNLNNVSWIT